MVTIPFASPLPVMVGLLTEVILWPPASNADPKARSLGVGATVSTVTGNAADRRLTSPKLLDAWAAMWCTPFASVAVAVMLHLPVADATAEPIGVRPSNSVTVYPAIAVPVKVGRVTFV